MTNFLRTASSFFKNPFINPFHAIVSHTGWQIRKVLNLFPYDINLEPEITVRIRDRSIANGCGALINAMGYYDPNNMYLLKDILDTGVYEIFFDVGANIGVYSLIGGSALRVKVFSFEPHPYTFSLLVENVAINCFGKHIKCSQIALGDYNGTVYLSDDPGSTINHVLENDLNSDEKKLSVEILRGDTFCQAQKVLPEILKIDVEGFENSVLEGFGDFLREVQIVFIECRNIEKTTRILCDKFGFLGPYKVDYRARRFSSLNINYEDWVFVSRNSLPLLQSLGFVFDMLDNV